MPRLHAPSVTLSVRQILDATGVLLSLTLLAYCSLLYLEFWFGIELDHWAILLHLPIPFCCWAVLHVAISEGLWLLHERCNTIQSTPTTPICRRRRPAYLDDVKHTFDCLEWDPNPASNPDGGTLISFPDAQTAQKFIRDEDDLRCGICIQDYKPGEQILLLPCSHRSHLECAADWFKESFTCPYCRGGFKWTIALKGEVAKAEYTEGEEEGGSEEGSESEAETESEENSSSDEDSESDGDSSSEDTSESEDSSSEDDSLSNEESDSNEDSEGEYDSKGEKY